jgi:hypothetical protein
MSNSLNCSYLNDSTSLANLMSKANFETVPKDTNIIPNPDYDYYQSRNSQDTFYTKLAEGNKT